MSATDLVQRLRTPRVDLRVAAHGISRLVVVVPHPDDESLSTGILLSQAAQLRIPTVVLAVTDGEAAYSGEDGSALSAVRRQEQADALAVLGHDASVRQCLGLPDGDVAAHQPLLVRTLQAHVDAQTLLVAPTVADWHPDHVACGEAAADVAARLGCRLWSSLFWAYHHPDALAPDTGTYHTLEGSPAHVAQRRRAVECHRSQLHHPGRAPILHASDLDHLDEPVELFIEVTP